MNSSQANRLAVVHGTLACLASGLALVFLVAWPGFGRFTAAESLRTPALAVQVASALYLAVVGWAEFRLAHALRRGHAPPASLWPLMGHLWVFMVVGACAMRGPASRAYLVGFDRTIAALATIGLLCTVASLVTALMAMRGEKAGHRRDEALARGTARGWMWLPLVAATLLIASLWWLESRPWELRRGGQPQPRSINRGFGALP